MGTIMTPEQMRELTDRLDLFAYISDAIGTAANLIRQMAAPPAPQPTAWRSVDEPLNYLTKGKDGQQFLNSVTMPKHAKQWAYQAPQPDDNAIQSDWNQLEAAQESLREHMQMIHDDTALLRQALEALVWASDLTSVAASHKPLHAAINAIRARLDGAPQPARVPMTNEQIRQARNEIVDPSFLDGIIVAECYHGIRSEE
jgi:hypothetical protein